MGKTTIVNGDAFFITGGNFKVHSQENIENYSQKQVIQKGAEKGVTHNKPKTPKLTDLKVTKVEGPFDKDGKLVTIVKKGEFFTYKATPSRKPTVSEVILLKWATKNDNGKVKELTGVSSHNQLSKEGKIIIGIAINEDCEKAKVYAYFKKANNSASVLTDVEIIEVILIVGTEQHSQTYGNKLMFPAQAVREIKENYKKTKKVTVIIFTDGFNSLQLSTIEKDSKKINSMVNFKEINSVTSLINYINKGDSVNSRNKVKIGVIKIFSHGLPSILDFGLDGSNENTQRFQISHVAMLKIESFSKRPEIYSYACRTGNADSNWMNTSYGKNWSTIVKPKESLAQKLSDHLDAKVFAFIRRSNYTSTWLDKGDENYKSKYVTIEDEEVSNPINPKDWFRKGWDDSLWNPDGAYAKPTVGDTPTGLPSEMYRFEKGKDPTK
jgi:hypothetical protein